MITVDRLILFGDDIQGLKLFYQSCFNFALVEEVEGEWVVLHAGSIEIAFHRIGEAYRNEKSLKFESNTKLVFGIDQDIAGFRTMLLAKGVAMGEIKSFEGVGFLHCDGTDMEGNVFQLRQKKL